MCVYKQLQQCSCWNSLVISMIILLVFWQLVIEMLGFILFWL